MIDFYRLIFVPRKSVNSLINIKTAFTALAGFYILQVYHL